MVEYAKALVQRPRILIIDEITSALYKEGRSNYIKESIKKLKSEGCSIIFISHRMPEVFDICDTVTVMRSGQSVADFDIEEVKEITLLSLMTGQRNRDRRYSRRKKIMMKTKIKKSCFRSET